MKNKMLSIVLFIVGFIGTYFFMCFCIPGLRIKLAAEPMEYLRESIKYLVVCKTIISCISGMILATIPYLIRKAK